MVIIIKMIFCLDIKALLPKIQKALLDSLTKKLINILTVSVCLCIHILQNIKGSQNQISIDLMIYNNFYTTVDEQM